MIRRAYALGVDFGTKSGRAVLVDCADGSELGTCVYPYRNGVIDERLPAARRRRAARAGLGAPRSTRLRANLPGGGARAARRGRRRPGGRGRHRHRLHRLHDPPDARRRHAAVPARRPARNPHAWVKLWKHHAAQPEADRSTRRRGRARRDLAATLRGHNLLRVVLRKGAADPRRGAGDLRARGPAPRGGRLGSLAAHRRRDAKHLHGRLQSDVVETRRSPPTHLAALDPGSRTLSTRR